MPIASFQKSRKLSFTEVRAAQSLPAVVDDGGRMRCGELTNRVAWGKGQSKRK